MKKSTVIVLMIVCALFSALSCAKATAPKAGSAKAQDMLSLLPQEAQGVIVIDVNRIMQTAAATKAIAENKKKEDYEKFIQETGIDPQKDVFYFVGAVMGAIGPKTKDGVALVNLRYNKDKLLALLKKERGEIATTEYNGFTIYQVPEKDEKKPVSGAFLDDSNIIFGTDLAVKKVIDVSQKKAPNIYKSEQLPALLKGMNMAAMVWGGMMIPPDTLKQASAQNPMLGTFADIKSIVISFDYKNSNVLAEIKAMSAVEAKNKQMADALTGFKALGAAAAAKEPQLGELLNKIEISSTADYVKITANIPEDLIQSLSQKAKVEKPKGDN
jgi:hypothetical protein